MLTGTYLICVQDQNTYLWTQKFLKTFNTFIKAANYSDVINNNQDIMEQIF